MTDLQVAFIMSMASVIAIAAVIIVLFHRLRQPLILGYLVAGMIAGHFVRDIHITETDDVKIEIEYIIDLLASMGIILLTFSIGLEFSFKQLRRIGIGVITAAAIEIALMIVIGFQLGKFIGWTTLEATLLGAMLSVASTMIIARSLRERGGLDNEKSRLIVGLLVVEDFAAVLLLGVVSGLVSTEGLSARIWGLLFGMAVFVAASFLVGIVVIPRIVDYVGRQRSNELLVLTALGLCFSMAVFARWIGLSEAIGAFIMGVIISESRYIGDVVRRIEPIRDLFGAIFFITVGMLVDFSDANINFALTALLITAVFVVAKLFSVSISTFITGFGARNSIGAGLSMIAIGEFSLMIAKVAATPGAGLDESLVHNIYPTIVIVTTLTALIVPYSVKYSDKLTRRLEIGVPRQILMLTSYLNLVFRNLRRRSRSSNRTSNEMRASISRMALYILVMVMAITFAEFAMPMAEDYADIFGDEPGILRLVILEGALVVVTLSLVGIWSRTVKLTEIGTSEAMLATRSAESMGYETTARALKWALLAFYMFAGFVVASPLIRSVVQESIVFGVVTLSVIAAAIIILWRSIKTVDTKLAEIFERREVEPFGDSSRDLEEIEDIIAAMEGGKR